MSALPIRPGGTGTAADVALVAAELVHVPAALTERMAAAGVEIVACRNSVVEVEPGLSGKVPRHWCQHPALDCPVNGRCRNDPPDCRTWDSVPGVYQPDGRRVVIATIGGQVPPPGPTTHGSVSLAVHESMHGADYVGGKPSQSPRFRAAWDADLALLGPYFSAGEAGREESYAESAAREFGLNHALSGRWPALAAYWAQPALAAQDGSDVAGLVENDAAAPIGYGVIDGPERATLYLRAEGENGECGHGAVSVPLTDLPLPMRDRLLFEAQLEQDDPVTFVVPANFDWAAGG